MKIFDRKDVYSWSNAEDAKQYIGKACYFADSLRYLKTIINEDEKYILKDVFDNEKDMVQGVFCDVDGDFWGLCLPAEKIIDIEEEKKYRPFTLEEFNKIIPMGTVFKYRYKSRNGSDNRYVKSIYYHANLDCENGYQAIFFEDCCFNLGYCFEVMELFLNGKWQPFGVLDES